jgi:hypothetical protein
MWTANPLPSTEIGLGNIFATLRDGAGKWPRKNEPTSKHTKSKEDFTPHIPGSFEI